MGLSLSRSVKSPSTYLLLVEWERVEDHAIGFRESKQYQKWHAVLHHFYEPLPRVEHFQTVVSGEPLVSSCGVLREKNPAIAVVGFKQIFVATPVGI